MTPATDENRPREATDAQRRVFERHVGRVFGNLHLEHPELTRDEVRDILKNVVNGEVALELIDGDVHGR